MRVVFVRHGEKRRGESDPELTANGRRMAHETGLWLTNQGLVPSLFVSTPTARTRQTVEELVRAMASDAPTEEGDLPELEDDLEAMLGRLAARSPSLEVVICVGHHPTIDMLKRSLSVPVQIPRVNLACAIVLEASPGGDAACVAAWPGRPSY